MNDHLIYESAMQVVPLLLIALFLENRGTTDAVRSATGRRLLRLQDQVIAVLGFIAFFTSLFVLAGVFGHNSLTSGIVIAAISGAAGLLFGIIWRRFGRPA